MTAIRRNIIKIVFIELPHVYLIQQRTQSPLGLMYLSAVLEKNGYDVEIIRLVSLDMSDSENYIPEADLYGISSVSLDYSSAKVIGKILKGEGKKVIIGGYHATAETDSVRSERMEGGDFLWDSVCIGEFETTIVQVVKDFEKNDNRKVYYGSRTNNLDKIPFPARHLIKDQGGAIFAYDKHYSDNELSTVISGSRGCYFNCCFCATKCMWGKGVRFRGAENVFEEIKHCIDVYDIREFRFSDELFTANRKRVKELMKLLKGEDVFWKCSTRVDCVDENLLEEMKGGGCKEIAFGIESADEDVLKAINKKNEIEDSKRIFDICSRIDINTRVLMMINTPGETVLTVDKNIEFLESVPYTCASVSVFRPLPGSPAWDNPGEFGIHIINRNLDDYNIYMWINGQINENNSESVFTIDTLPDVQSQINNRRKMINYFSKNMKMNEMKRFI